MFDRRSRKDHSTFTRTCKVCSILVVCFTLWCLELMYVAQTHHTVLTAIENGQHFPAENQQSYVPAAGKIEKREGFSVENIHIVVSTSCNIFSDWSTEILIYSHYKLRHPGRITRILTCSEKEFENYKLPQIWYDKYDIHRMITPLGGFKWLVFNKVISLLDWIENREENFDVETVILLDSDFVLTGYLTDEVSEGHPRGAHYFYGGKWRMWHEVCSGNCAKISEAELAKYNPGSPYMVHIEDWKRILPIWKEKTPYARAKTGSQSADMMAYSIAIADLDLPHNVSDRLMISNAKTNYEGWDWVNLTDRDHNSILQVPTLHYCQKYVTPKYSFYKRDIPKIDYLSCNAPTNEFPFPKVDHWEAVETEEDIRNAWMISHLMPIIREAFEHYKELFCT